MGHKVVVLIPDLDTPGAFWERHLDPVETLDDAKIAARDYVKDKPRYRDFVVVDEAVDPGACYTGDFFRDGSTWHLVTLVPSKGVKLGGKEGAEI